MQEHQQELHSALLTAGDKQPLVDTLAACAGLALPAASKAVITAHLVVAAEMAQLLFAAPAPALDAEAAAVFRLPVCAAGDGGQP